MSAPQDKMSGILPLPSPRRKHAPAQAGVGVQGVMPVGRDRNDTVISKMPLRRSLSSARLSSG
jgi:hypothetical protein